MIIHVVAEGIPLGWNADTARVFVRAPARGLQSGRINKAISSTITAGAATWIHFCGNPMPLIKTVAIVPP